MDEVTKQTLYRAAEYNEICKQDTIDVQENEDLKARVAKLLHRTNAMEQTVKARDFRALFSKPSETDNPFDLNTNGIPLHVALAKDLPRRYLRSLSEKALKMIHEHSPHFKIPQSFLNKNNPVNKPKNVSTDHTSLEKNSSQTTIDQESIPPLTREESDGRKSLRLSIKTSNPTLDPMLVQDNSPEIRGISARGRLSVRFEATSDTRASYDNNGTTQNNAETDRTHNVTQEPAGKLSLNSNFSVKRVASVNSRSLSSTKISASLRDQPREGKNFFNMTSLTQNTQNDSKSSPVLKRLSKIDPEKLLLHKRLHIPSLMIGGSDDFVHKLNTSVTLNTSSTGLYSYPATAHFQIGNSSFRTATEQELMRVKQASSCLPKLFSKTTRASHKPSINSSDLSKIDIKL